MEKRVCKGAQMKLSFGMIFSVILIIIFLSFAFYVIKMLLDSQAQGTILLFADGLQDDIDKAWKGDQTSQEISYKLPSKIELVCFVDFNSGKKGEDDDIYTDLRKGLSNGDENLVFYPVGSGKGLDSKLFKHINITSITKEDNPYCIENNGKVEIILKKSYGENLVRIEKL